MNKETNMLEEMMKLAKKYGYTISDFTVDDTRIEIGMLKDTQIKFTGDRYVREEFSGEGHA